MPPNRRMPLLLLHRRPLLLLLPPRRSKADGFQSSASCKKPAFGPAFLFPRRERKHHGMVSSLPAYPRRDYKFRQTLTRLLSLHIIAHEHVAQELQVFPGIFIPGDETGSRCVHREITADNPGTAPATVNESRRINRHCVVSINAREGDSPGQSTREPGDRPEANQTVSRRAARAALASRLPLLSFLRTFKSTTARVRAVCGGTS